MKRICLSWEKHTNGQPSGGGANGAFRGRPQVPCECEEKKKASVFRTYLSVNAVHANTTVQAPKQFGREFPETNGKVAKHVSEAFCFKISPRKTHSKTNKLLLTWKKERLFVQHLIKHIATSKVQERKLQFEPQKTFLSQKLYLVRPQFFTAPQIKENWISCHQHFPRIYTAYTAAADWSGKQQKVLLNGIQDIFQLYMHREPSTSGTNWRSQPLIVTNIAMLNNRPR